MQVLRPFASLAAAALAMALAAATPLTVINQCSQTVNLYDNSYVESLAPGATTSRTLPQGFNGMFRDGTNSQATLAEFSITGGFAWYDISIIPTGPKSGPEYCPDLESCKELTGGVGYNTPMQIAPSGCQTVTCLADGCADAYQFPKDDGKTHACSDSTTITLTFCPGGSGGSTPAPSTQAPTQAPTPEPTTQAPTPAPTPEPTTEAPTPEPTTEAPTPEPTTEAPTSEPTPEPTSASASASIAGDSSSAEASTSASASSSGSGSLLAFGSAENATIAGSSSEDEEVAGDADEDTVVTSAPRDTAAANSVPVLAPATTKAAASSSSSAEKITTKDGDSGSSLTTVLIAIVGAVAGVGAIAAVVLVRKKKAELEANEPKNSIYAAGDALVTPVDNITVL